jgi:valyl-tRNA synthetase
MKHAKLQPEDRWIISRINGLVKSTTGHMETFHFHLAGRGLCEFILNDFSRWYIKLVRDRVSPFSKGPDKQAAQATLQYVLELLLKLLAPFTPFITEKIHLQQYHGKSIHLEDWPVAEEARIAPNLEEGMESVKVVIEAMNALRQEKKAKLRWPIDRLFLSMEKRKERHVKGLEDVIKLMGNVKEVVWKAPEKGKPFEGGTLELGNVLKDEALVRELIRKIQALRKESELKVSEQIKLSLQTDKTTEMILKRFERGIRSGTGSSRLTLGPVRTRKATLEFDRKKIIIFFTSKRKVKKRRKQTGPPKTVSKK